MDADSVQENGEPEQQDSSDQCQEGEPDAEGVAETAGSEASTEGSDFASVGPERAPIEAGAPVAVFCRADPESKHEDWILATLIRRLPETDECEVEDVESADSHAPPFPAKASRPNALRLTVSSSMVQRLPASDAEAHQLAQHIRLRQQVLALFPGTTCLYPAVVMSIPSRVL